MIFIKSDILNLVYEGDVGILRFKALSKYDFINHAVSTRHGGVSVSRGLEKMNLGTYTSDDFDNVKQNYRLFCKAAGFDAKRVVLGNQTHELNVRYVTESDCGKGVFCNRDYNSVDALVTDVKNIPLVIHTADCVPVSLIDTSKKVIGCAHCGWRGTYGRLAALTLDVMINKFQTNPCDIVATVGPCICGDCYEVSEDLYTNFAERFNSSCLVNNNGYYIDLAGLNKKILADCGVPEDNIIVSDICTCCNTDLLFSHRGQGPERGIFATFLQLV